MPTLINMTVPQLAAMCVEHMPDDAWNHFMWSRGRNRPLCYVFVDLKSCESDRITPLGFLTGLKRNEIGAKSLMNFSSWWRSFSNASEALNELWKLAQEADA